MELPLELPLELPRELQVHILSFLYDPCRRHWRSVMRELESQQIETQTLVLSRFMRKYMPGKMYTICLDCGNYYKIPFYGSLAMYCECP
jgi:hypothetical protein